MSDPPPLPTATNRSSHRQWVVPAIVGVIAIGLFLALSVQQGCELRESAIVENNRETSDSVGADEARNSDSDSTAGQASSGSSAAEPSSVATVVGSTAGDSTTSYEKPTGAAEALDRARELYSAAEHARAGGRFGSAFRDAARAWSIAAAQGDDAECRELAEKIHDQLDDLADKANRQASGSTRADKPLIER